MSPGEPTDGFIDEIEGFLFTLWPIIDTAEIRNRIATSQTSVRTRGERRKNNLNEETKLTFRCLS